MIRCLFFFVALLCSHLLQARNTLPEQSIGNLNMVFVQNKGQIRDQHGAVRGDIDVSLKDKDMNLFISSGQIHYQFKKNAHPVVHTLADLLQRRPTSASVTYELYRVDMELLGANLQVKPIMSQRRAIVQHFFIDGSSILDVSAFEQLTYKNVYPGIDWVVYLSAGKLKYDFVLQAGADPSMIRIKYHGATSAAVGVAGSLQVETPLGTLVEDAPVAWTAMDKKNVPCHFSEKEGVWGFTTAPYTGGLVLDPGLGWATYFGGSSIEGYTNSMFMCTAPSAPYDLYFTTETQSIDRIATTGAYQTTYKGNTDAFLGKMSPEGKLLWATYFGGSDEDIATSVSADKFGGVFIGGSALSKTLATPGAHNTLKAGIAFNTYMAKFDTSGKLKWSTYYGQAGGDYERAFVAAASDGAVYLCSSTKESTGIATPGAFKEKPVATSDVYSAFLVKFDSTGKRLWGTYYGGAGVPGNPGADGYTLVEGGMAIDGQDNVFILGSVNGSANFNFPGAFQPLFAGAGYDCFLGKFNAEGKHQWGTYLGTVNEDRARTICTDRSGNVLVGITSLGAGDLATAGSSRSTSIGEGEFMGDFFLGKFGGDGKRIWGTYVGPEKGIAMLGGLAVDACDNVYLDGSTIGFTDIKPTEDAYQAKFEKGTNPGFFSFNTYLLRYAAEDGQLQYSSFYGKGSTQSSALCADPLGTLYLGGMIDVDSGMATAGAYQNKRYGEVDILISQFATVNIADQFWDTLVCVGGTFELPYATSATYAADNEFSVEMADKSGAFNYANPLIIGTAKASKSGSITCSLPASALAGEVYRVRLRASNPGVVASCWSTITVRQNGEPAEISIDKFTLGTSHSYASYQWYFNGAPIDGATDSTYVVTENGDYSVVVTEANGCVDSSNVYNVNNVAVSEYAKGTLSIHIYPNPTFDVLYVETQQPYSATLTDIAGRTLLQTKDQKLSLKQFAAGTYILELRSTAGQLLLRRKIVKTAGL